MAQKKKIRAVPKQQKTVKEKVKVVTNGTGKTPRGNPIPTPTRKSFFEYRAKVANQASMEVDEDFGPEFFDQTPECWEDIVDEERSEMEIDGVHRNQNTQPDNNKDSVNENAEVEDEEIEPEEELTEEIKGKKVTLINKGVPARLALKWLKSKLHFKNIPAWYKGDFTIPKAVEWAENKFSPSAAIKWRLHGHSVAEARYFRSKLINPAIGQRWLALKMTHEEIQALIEHKVDIQYAEDWNVEGYMAQVIIAAYKVQIDCAFAKEMKARGITPSLFAMYKELFRTDVLAMDWARTGETPEACRSWAAYHWPPNEIRDWADEGIPPAEARLWKYTNIKPGMVKKLIEEGWDHKSAQLWGPFKRYTPKQAKEWKAAGYTPAQMKYWTSLGRTLGDAEAFAAEAVTTEKHKGANFKKMTIEEWITWKPTNIPYGVAADWMEYDFNIQESKKWRDINVEPKLAAKLQSDNVEPEEVSTWIKIGFLGMYIGEWKQVESDPTKAYPYYKFNFKPEVAKGWLDLGVEAEHAVILAAENISAHNVEAWMHQQQTSYAQIREYLSRSYNISQAIKWMRSETKKEYIQQWIAIQVDQELAKDLDQKGISPMSVKEWIEAGFNRDEAITNISKGITLEKVFLPKRKPDTPTSGASYSTKVTGKVRDINTTRQDVMRAKLHQWGTDRLAPKSALDKAMRIFYNEVAEGDFDTFMRALREYFEAEHSGKKLAYKFNIEQEWLDVAFATHEDRDMAVSKGIAFMGKNMKTATTRFSGRKTKWVSFTNIPTDVDHEETMEAIKTGLSYYGTIKEWQTTTADILPSVFAAGTAHALFEPSPLMKLRNLRIPKFIRIPSSKQVITVEPEDAPKVCRFCYGIGHVASVCYHRKGTRANDIHMDLEKGVTICKGKTFLRPKPIMWTDMPGATAQELRAVRFSLEERHKIAHEREAEMARDDEFVPFQDVTAPDMGEEEATTKAADPHPDQAAWEEANKPKNKSKPKNKKQNTKVSKPDTNNVQEVNQEKKTKIPKTKAQSEGDAMFDGMDVDISEEEMAESRQAFTTQPLPNSGLHSSRWRNVEELNPKEGCSHQPIEEEGPKQQCEKSQEQCDCELPHTGGSGSCL